MHIHSLLLMLTIHGMLVMATSGAADAESKSTLSVTATVLPTKKQRFVKSDVVVVSSSGVSKVLSTNDKVLYASNPTAMVTSMKSDGRPFVLSIRY